MKEKFLNSFFVCIRILASAWLTFLVSIIPLYIWRGTRSGNESGENLLMSVIGLIYLAAFIVGIKIAHIKKKRFLNDIKK